MGEVQQHKIILGPPSMFDPPRELVVEGDPVVLFTCRVCGAAVMADPKQASINPMDTHREYHERRGDV